MRIVLIYPDYPKADLGGCYYEGIASLSSCLKQEGHEILFYHVTNSLSAEILIKSVEKVKPDCVAFSSSSPMAEYVEEWAPAIKNCTDALTVWGGVHCRMFPENAIESRGIDAVCYGEGDLSFPELLRRYENGADITETDNFLFKREGKLIWNKLKFVDNLEDLPDPDREIFNFSNLYEYTKPGRYRFTSFMFARGCPYNCDYCGNHRIKRDYIDQESFVRTISPERAIRRIKNHLILHPETDYVRIEDSNINLKTGWFNEFIEIYKEEIKAPYYCQTRPELVTEDFVKTLKETNCLFLVIAVENGNEQFRKKMLNRKMSNQLYKEVFKLCDKYKVIVRTSNMIGLPEETIELALETIRFNEQLGSYDASVSVFYSLPGTKIDDYCKSRGYYMNTSEEIMWTDSTLIQDSISNKDVLVLHRAWFLCLYLYAFARKNGNENYKLIDDLIISFLKAIPEDAVNKPFLDNLQQLSAKCLILYQKVKYHSLDQYHPFAQSGMTF